jgi:CHAD domain-containing protein
VVADLWVTCYTYAQLNGYPGGAFAFSGTEAGVEIEAKFSVLSEETFQRLVEAEHLDAFTLGAARTVHVRDSYMDTAGRLIQVAGYSCRKREHSGGVVITLKSLRKSEGTIHRREEHEVPLAAYVPPSEWPTAPVREKVLGLIGDAHLDRLFDLEQTRHVRPVLAGDQTVAELSLDRVQMAVGTGEQAYLELEVELKGDGAEEDLLAVASCLRNDWGLRPEARSKFERGLQFAGDAATSGRLLTAEERAIASRIAGREDLHGRRATALLALNEGTSQAAAGQAAGMSERRARHWLALFRQKRLDVFPGRVLAAASAPSESLHDEVLFYPAEKSRHTAVLIGHGADAEPLPSQAVALQVEAPPDDQPAATAHAAAAELESPQLPRGAGLNADDSMAEAARKTLLFHFQRMMACEAGTRLGEDPEQLHDMRVATRRMRAAIPVFHDYLNLEQMAPFVKGMRRAGRTLGTVRDLDVFFEKMQRYLSTLPAERRSDLDPLLEVWRVQRERARGEMLCYLDSGRYACFVQRFGEFLSVPGAAALPTLSSVGEPLPNRLRHVVPTVLYRHLAEVRAYDEWMAGQSVPLGRYHQLRIASKGLRYTLEFFREILGSGAGQLIEEVKELQDLLGDINDAVVACNLLRDYLTWGTWGRTSEQASFSSSLIVSPGAAAYLAYRQSELQGLLLKFPDIWKGFQGPKFSRWMARAVAVL